jgi:hypothetical protein
MLALLAPVPIQAGVPSDTARILDEKTQLAPPPAATMAPAPQSNRLVIWGVVGASGLLVLLSCILVSVIIGFWALKKDDAKKDDDLAKVKSPDVGNTGGDKDKNPAVPQPKVLIDEDFREAYKKKLGVPDGWKSDEFTTFKINEVYGMQPVAPTGAASVLVPLSSPLKGDFLIQGVYHMDHPSFGQYHTFTVSLESRKKTALLTVVFDWEGKVLINKDAKAPPLNYKPLLPTAFQVRREGTKIRAYLDEFPPVEKNLDDVAEYETLRLVMTAGTGNAGRRLRLHGLKVTAMP